MAGKVRRSADLVERLQSAASKGPLQPSLETLRGLLDESGLYDRVGGVDEVIRQAEQASKRISKNPPETGVMGIKELHEIYDADGNVIGMGGFERPVPYRTLFPSIDYSRADRPVPVFFEGNPVFHEGNSSQYGTHEDPDLQSYAKWASYKLPSSGRRLFTGQLIGNPVYVAKAVAANAGMAPYAPASRSQSWTADWMQQVMDERDAVGRTTPYVQIGLQMVPQGWASYGHTQPESIMGTMLHEVGHYAHRPALYSLFEDNAPMGATKITKQYLNKRLQPTLVTLPGMENLDGQFGQFASYRMRPIELDQMVADIKRAYAEGTGRLVRTRADAEDALLWYMNNPNMAEFRPVEGPFDQRFVADADNAAAYWNPMQAMQSTSPDAVQDGLKVNRKQILDRMTEIFGFGGALVLANLLDDENK